MQQEGLAGNAESVSGAYRHRAAKMQKAAAKRVCAVQRIEVATFAGERLRRIILRQVLRVGT